MTRHRVCRNGQVVRLLAGLLLGVIPVPVALSQQPKADVNGGMLVSTSWLESHLQDDDLVVLCIADSEQFYSAGHIPGSRLIRLSEIVTTRDGIPNELPTVEQLRALFERAGVSNGSRIILYGERSGLLAARAYFTLDYLGLADQVALLDGGIEKWRAEQRPESTGTSHIAAGSLRARPRPEIVVDTPRMAEYAHARSASRALIDARPRVEYSGEKLSEDVSKAGHIPNATNLYWRDLLQDGIPKLRPAPQLRNSFAAAGATPGKEVITYCRTGMQSSFDYFVARYLGYPARMYDASFYVWSRSSRPVERALQH